MADLKMTTKCLQENLALLTDAYGSVKPENIAIWNISNALLGMSDALQEIQKELKSVKSELYDLTRRR